MTIRSDRAAERRARKNADKDLKEARKAARKAIDLKDPRFLAEAAAALSRGPAGLALFGASRGLSVARERRAEQAAQLKALAGDARAEAKKAGADTRKAVAKTEKEQARAIAKERKQVDKERRALDKRLSPRRRFAPLWAVGLLGGAAVAGATAFFLRDQGAPVAAPAPKPTPAPPAPPAQDVVDAKAPEVTGEDLVVDTPDPEGPGDQDSATTPAAAASDTTSADNAPAPGSAAPGAAAGIAPQPSPEQVEGSSDDAGLTPDDK